MDQNCNVAIIFAFLSGQEATGQMLWNFCYWNLQ